MRNHSHYIEDHGMDLTKPLKSSDLKPMNSNDGLMASSFVWRWSGKCLGVALDTYWANIWNIMLQIMCQCNVLTAPAAACLQGYRQGWAADWLTEPIIYICKSYVDFFTIRVIDVQEERFWPQRLGSQDVLMFNANLDSYFIHVRTHTNTHTHIHTYIHKGTT